MTKLEKAILKHNQAMDEILEVMAEAEEINSWMCDFNEDVLDIDDETITIVRQSEADLMPRLQYFYPECECGTC